MASYAMLVTVLCLMSMSMVQGVQHLEDALRSAFYRVFENNAPLVKGVPQHRGVVQSCGPPDANFSVEWEPEVIDPEGHIKVYYNYTIPHDFNSGTAYVALYFKKIQNPIFEDSFPIGCDKIRKYLPCPFKRGLPLHGVYPYSNLLILKGYDGTYKAKLKLTNEKNEVMFCAIIEVTIKGRGNSPRAAHIITGGHH